MDREQMEGRLAHLRAQYQQAEAQRNQFAQEVDRLNRALVMLEGGIAELQFVLAQDVEEDDGDTDTEDTIGHKPERV